MMVIKNIVELLFSLALFVNFLLFVPQAIKIFKKKHAKDVSITTFLGFFLIQMAIALHGLFVQDYFLFFGYVLSMITCGSVIILILRFSRPGNDYNIDLADIIASLPEHVYWKGKNYVCLGCNTNSWKDFGFKSYEEYLGKNDYDILPKEQADKIRSIDEEVVRTGKLKVIEEITRKSNGQDFLYLSYKVPLKNKKEETIGVLGLSVDITRAKQEVEDKLEMLENIIAMMPGHVYWVDRSGCYLGCNDIQAKLAGLDSRKEIVGKHNRELPWNLNAGKLPSELDTINEEVMEKRESIVLEEPAILRDGTKATFLSSKVPLLNQNNQVIGMVGISVDITDRKRAEEAERQRLAAELKAEKMEAKIRLTSLFASNMSHNVSPILSSIQNCTHMIRDVFPELLRSHQLAVKAGLPVSDISRESLGDLISVMEMMQHQTTKGLNYLRNTLKKMTLEKRAKMTLVKCSIKECLNAALNQCRYMHATQMNKVHVVDGDDFEFQGSPDDIEVALVNLLDNAFDAIREANKGEIFIDWVKELNFNILRIKDTGTGISADKMSKLFELYVTFKKHGTGVGLASARATIQQLGGDLTCHSVEGEYTVFELKFPCHH